MLNHTLQSHIIGVFVPPNATSVVLRACYYGVTLVVKRTRENLVRVTLQLLQHLSTLTVPYSCDLVKTGSQNFGSLRVENNLRNVLFMA